MHTKITSTPECPNNQKNKEFLKLLKIRQPNFKISNIFEQMKEDIYKWSINT